MKAKDVYLKAARLMEKGKDRDHERGSCTAIADVLFPRKASFRAYQAAKSLPVVQDYVDLFAPGYASKFYWGNEWGDDRINCRILALCFMAAIIGGRKSA